MSSENWNNSLEAFNQWMEASHPRAFGSAARRALCIFPAGPSTISQSGLTFSLAALEEIVTEASSPGRKHNPKCTPAWPHLITHSKWSIIHLCRALEENGSHSHHERLCTTQPHAPEGLFSILLLSYFVQRPLNQAVLEENVFFKDSGLNKTTLQRWSCKFNNALKINPFICISRATIHLWAVWLCVLCTGAAGRARQQRQHTRVSPM